MDKQQFLYELTQKLQGLPPCEIDKIISFYDESIFDRTESGISEQQAVKELGDIDTIAQEILADISGGQAGANYGYTGTNTNSAYTGANANGGYAHSGENGGYTYSGTNGNYYANYNANTQNPNYNSAAYSSTTSKNSGFTIFLIVLAVISSPIWVPLALSALAAIFSLFVAVWAFVLSLFALPLAFFVSAITSIFIFVYAININFLAALMAIGMLILFIGLFLLTLALAIITTKYAAKLTVAIANFFIGLFKKNRRI